MRKNIFRRILPFLLCVLCVSSLIPESAFAFDEGGTTAKGFLVAPEMNDNGDIVFTLEASKASNTTKWKTVGFYITTKTTNECGTSSASAHKSAIFLKNSWATNKVVGAKVKTTFTIPSSVVQSACKKAGIDLSELDYIYLQGILVGYNGSTNYTYNCYTWGQMSSTGPKNTNYSMLRPGHKSPIYWANHCYEDWHTRYDIKVKIKTKEIAVRMNYYVKGAVNSSKLYTRAYTVRSDEDKKWTSSTHDTSSSIKQGNGLGFTKEKYRLGIDKVKLGFRSAPRRLSMVIGKSNLTQYTDGEDYYLYRVSYSYGNRDTLSTGVKPQNGAIAYYGDIIDGEGNFTDEYKEALEKIVSGVKKGIQNTEYTVKKDPKKDIDYTFWINCFYRKDTPGKKTTSENEDFADNSDAIIQSDVRHAETYDSTVAIPTTETQYVNVFSKDYLFKYAVKTISGTKTYPQLRDEVRWGSYTDSEGNSHSYSYIVTVTDYVPRSYTYRAVESLGVWKIEKANIKNESLPGGEVVLTPSSSYKAPKLTYSATGHMADPDGVGTYSVGECKVWNDTVKLNGETIMDGSMYYCSTPESGKIPIADMTDENVLYVNGQLIDRDLANAIYESEGTITYRAIKNINTGKDDTLVMEINGINDVVVHTPTTCDASVSDIRSYNQMVDPDTSVPSLVLDRTFVVRDISDVYHSDLKGYGQREYLRFIDKKEVKFPFDVYTTDSSGNPETYIKKDTWTELPLTASGEKLYYIPEWVNEGSYTIEFRNRAINCDANVLKGASADMVDALLEDVSEDTANTILDNYVAIDSVDVQVSGRVFGLIMYDHSDYPAWGENVFRMKDSHTLTGLYYSIGMNDRNGKQKRPDRNSKYVLPLLAGSHPYFTNYGILKTGYTQRFQLTTMGNMYSDTDYISITPTFYYVSKDGSSRQKVDIYYSETINGEYQKLVKIGSDLDKENTKSMSLSSPYTAVPSKELNTKAAVVGSSVKDISAGTHPVYTYGQITIPASLSTYVGDEYYPGGALPASGITKNRADKSSQRWYFEYSLPSEIHAVASGYDVVGYARDHYGIDYSEDFWKSDGYILVQWEITTYSSFTGITDDEGSIISSSENEISDVVSEGDSQPVGHLSYTNIANSANGYCNMWKLEGFNYTRTDSKGTSFNFKDGDVLLYYLDKSAKSDYRSYGTH